MASTATSKATKDLAVKGIQNAVNKASSEVSSSLGKLASSEIDNLTKKRKLKNAIVEERALRKLIVNHPKNKQTQKTKVVNGHISTVHWKRFRFSSIANIQMFGCALVPNDAPNK